MKRVFLPAICLLALVLAGPTPAQEKKPDGKGLKERPAAQKEKAKKDEDFAAEKPAVGDKLPDLTVYTPDGKAFKTADLRGHYTVLTFGCLT